MSTFFLHSVLWQRLVQDSEDWEGWANLQWLHALLLHTKYTEGSLRRLSSCCSPEPAVKMQVSSSVWCSGEIRLGDQIWLTGLDVSTVYWFIFSFWNSGRDGQSRISGNLLFHASRSWEVWVCGSSTYWDSSCLAIHGWRGRAEEGQEREGPQTLSHNSTLGMTASLLGHSCKCCTNLLREAKPTGPNLTPFH